MHEPAQLIIHDSNKSERVLFSLVGDHGQLSGSKLFLSDAFVAQRVSLQVEGGPTWPVNIRSHEPDGSGSFDTISFMAV